MWILYALLALWFLAVFINASKEVKYKTFYRVANLETKQGLWYAFDGSFTGLIHTEFRFCANCNLEMPYDKTLCGYLSATDSLDTLWQWFTKEDIIALQEHGWFIQEYQCDDYWFYDKFKHWVIKGDRLRHIRTITL